jgi:hypothetical protein
MPETWDRPPLVLEGDRTPFETYHAVGRRKPFYFDAMARSIV